MRQQCSGKALGSAPVNGCREGSNGEGDRLQRRNCGAVLVLWKVSIDGTKGGAEGQWRRPKGDGGSDCGAGERQRPVAFPSERNGGIAGQRRPRRATETARTKMTNGLGTIAVLFVSW